MNNFGNNVKELRGSNGLSQEDLAKSIGKNRNVIHYLEKGKTDITLKDAIKISKVLGMNLDDLINCEVDGLNIKNRYKKNGLNIINIHPNLKAEYNELPNDFKNFSMAVAVEVFNKFSIMPIDELINNLLLSLICEYKEIIKQSVLKKKCSAEVNNILIESAEMLLLNHKVS